MHNSYFDLKENDTNSPLTWDRVNKKSQFSKEAAKRIIEAYAPTRKKPRTLKQENKYFSFHVQRKPTILITNVSKSMFEADELVCVVNETIDVLKLATRSSATAVYIVDDLLDEIFPLTGEKQFDECRISYKIGTGTSVAAYVAATKEHVQIDDVLEDMRFPQGLGNFEVTVKSVICVPLLTPEGDCYAVVELSRKHNENVYDEADLRLVIVMCNWMGSAIYQLQLRETLQKQRELSEYLLDLTKIYFCDTKLLDVLISDIMNFSRNSLNAEHGVFYILQQREHHLYAEVWDEIEESNGEIFYERSDTILLKDCSEVVNTVLTKGVALNIKNAFFDSRVRQNKQFYVITSILCAPVKIMDEILGAIMVVNKRKVLCFSKWDEYILQTFCAHCGNVLSYNKLHQRNRLTINLNKVYLEMLSNHMMPCIHDIYYINYRKSYELFSPPKFHQFNYYIVDDAEIMTPHLIIHMFNELLPDAIEPHTLVKLVLAVRKSQANKDSPYFNFLQTFYVVHCVYNILKMNLDIFTRIEIQALLIAALCHSLIDTALSNSYMCFSNYFLNELYEEHTKQNHCYHVAVFVLKFLKVFDNLSTEDYELFLKELHYCMISTDITTHISRRNKMTALCDAGTFDPSNKSHRNLLKSVIMTMGYFCMYCKPYNISREIAEHWYKQKKQEYDLINERGVCSTIIPKESKLIPVDQLRIIDSIMPCAQLICKAMPNCIWLQRDVKRLREAWKETLDNQGMKMWYIEDSIPSDKLRTVESHI